jgi:hypothetical protein
MMVFASNELPDTYCLITISSIRNPYNKHRGSCHMRKKVLSKRYRARDISGLCAMLKNTFVVVAIGIILCLASVLATTPQPAFSVTFGPVTNLSNDSDNSGDGNTFVVKSGNKVYVVWANEINDIFFKRSTDKGTTFEPTKNISNDPGFNGKPRIAASGNNVYVVWEGEGASGSRDVFLVRSTDGGNNFKSPINLSNNPGDTENPKVAASGSNVYVVWADESPGNFEVLFKRSTNNGASFGSIKNLSNNPPDSLAPRVKASGDNVYVVWSDDNDPKGQDVFYKRSTNNGASFGSTKDLSGSTNGGAGQIAITGKNVYISWTSGTDIFFKRSTNEGASFGSTKNLSNNPGLSEVSRIGASGNNVYVIWMDDTGIPGGNCTTTADNCDVFFRASNNKGASFSGTINLSNNPEASWGSNVLASGNSVYVLWDDATPGNFDIFFRESHNKGASFDDAINVSDNTGDSGPPDMSRKGNSAYVVWEDVTPGNGEILFKKGH